MNIGITVALVVAFFGGLSLAEAGHESPYYPSFYPQELRIEPVDLASAATLLRDGSIHAYIGGDPFSGAKVPGGVSSAESLGSYLVITFSQGSTLVRNREKRCAAASTMLDTLAQGGAGFIYHPYPVTPFHSEYLQHFDLAEASKTEHRSRPAGDHDGAGQILKVRAKGPLAEKLVRSRWRVDEREWDATVEEVDLGDLISSRLVNLNGWLGPPWIKEGWFHAYLLLAGAVTDSQAERAIGSIYRRLVRGNYRSLEEKINLERSLVSLLIRGCERVPVGYTVRHEYYNSDYSDGVENVAYDSYTGFNSPIFIRTVKLKDFPWNGWLRIGVRARPVAAWNPIGGFTDTVGRLVWYAVGDPALFPAPYNGSWIPNRVRASVTARDSTSGRVEIPRDALLPETGTGFLREVGEGKSADTKVTYKVLTSSFHDGSRMSVADIFYPYIFAYRWSTGKAEKGTENDSSIEASTALIRERLAGLKVLKVEPEIRDVGGIIVKWENPVIELYLQHSALDPLQVASLAPPWSSLPWHLIVLMEEAVKRGFGAFSSVEAARHHVGWLDLVKEEKIKPRLALLVKHFELQGYVPNSLKGLVKVDEARQRWAALKQFYRKHGHFLVTNGPYQLHKWSEDSAVLQVFRDLSYPLQVGAFDDYPLPRKAYISRLDLRSHTIEIHVEVEKVIKFQRTYDIVRQPLRNDSKGEVRGEVPLCSYVMVSPDGAVVKAGNGRYAGDDTFIVDLQESLKPGLYTIMTAVYLGGNFLNPMVKTSTYRVEGAS